MKVKPLFLFSWLLLLVGAGCASNQDSIVFNDEGAIHGSETRPAVLLSPDKLEKGDELKIELAVFSYLLERHFWDLGEYSAVFLRADDAQVDWLMKKYSAHMPPIKPAYHEELPANQTPLDKDTGKPAMILSVDVDEPAADGSVSAIGKWYAGGAAAGFYTFVLKKTGDGWEIQTVK